MADQQRRPRRLEGPRDERGGGQASEGEREKGPRRHCVLGHVCRAVSRSTRFDRDSKSRALKAAEAGRLAKGKARAALRAFETGRLGRQGPSLLF